MRRFITLCCNYVFTFLNGGVTSHLKTQWLETTIFYYRSCSHSSGVSLGAAVIAIGSLHNHYQSRDIHSTQGWDWDCLQGFVIHRAEKVQQLGPFGQVSISLQSILMVRPSWKLWSSHTPYLATQVSQKIVPRDSDLGKSCYYLLSPSLVSLCHFCHSPRPPICRGKGIESISQPHRGGSNHNIKREQRMRYVHSYGRL